MVDSVVVKDFIRFCKKSYIRYPFLMSPTDSQINAIVSLCRDDSIEELIMACMRVLGGAEGAILPANPSVIMIRGGFIAKEGCVIQVYHDNGHNGHNYAYLYNGLVHTGSGFKYELKSLKSGKRKWVDRDWFSESNIRVVAYPGRY